MPNAHRTGVAEYSGFIHADAHPLFVALFLPEGATEVACWAHARRKFIDAENTDPELAKRVIEGIGKLYVIERAAKDADMDLEQKLALRQGQGVPVLGEAEPKVLPNTTWKGCALRASSVVGAVCLPQRCRLSSRQAAAGGLRRPPEHWLELAPMPTLRSNSSQFGTRVCNVGVYMTDGRLAIDNNPAERALCPFAVGRKNWLFVQNVKGGERAAILMSLVITAKAIGLNPVMYLRDALVWISSETDVAKLTPHGWKQHYAAEVEREYQAAVSSLPQS